MKLNLFEKAITWCDEGLAVSFDFIFMVAAHGCKDLLCITIMVGNAEGGALPRIQKWTNYRISTLLQWIAPFSFRCREEEVVPA